MLVEQTFKEIHQRQEDFRYLLEVAASCSGDYSFAENIDRYKVREIAERQGIRLYRDDEEECVNGVIDCCELDNFYRREDGTPVHVEGLDTW